MPENQTPQLSPELIVAVVFITGFAVQQILQIFDPLVAKFANLVKNRPFFKDLASVTEADLKKATMYLLAFLFGMLTVWSTKISILSLIPDKNWGGTVGDFFVSALVIGSGTEAANTLLKYFGYIKEAKKAEIQSSVEVLIIHDSVTVSKTTTFQFQAIVKNTPDTTIEWSVLEGNGGSIDATGKYTAPSAGGTFHIFAISKADRTKNDTAIVTVPN